MKLDNPKFIQGIKWLAFTGVIFITIFGGVLLGVTITFELIINSFQESYGINQEVSKWFDKLLFYFWIASFLLIGFGISCLVGIRKTEQSKGN